MEIETKRKIIHIGNGFWTFLLPFIDRLPAILIVTIAFILVFFFFRPNSPFGLLFHRVFSTMARPNDNEKKFLKGPSLYVFMVLLLVIFIDFRIAGALFAILAFGDGTATLVGHNYGKTNLTESKTLEGSIAFFISSFFSGLLIFILIDHFNSPTAKFDHPFLILLPDKLVSHIGLFPIIIIFLVLVVILTLVELYLAKFLDDNILIPLLGSILLFALFQLF
ncbi:MAG: hypothetical protein ACXAC7_12205 [Candidatus Hodarchaeales archaeon]|jgi:dolichol kinase